MNEWDMTYQDEIQELDRIFQLLYLSWNELEIDYRNRPYSFDRLKESVDEMLDAYSYFKSEIED